MTRPSHCFLVALLPTHHSARSVRGGLCCTALSCTAMVQHDTRRRGRLTYESRTASLLMLHSQQVTFSLQTRVCAACCSLMDGAVLTPLPCMAQHS